MNNCDVSGMNNMNNIRKTLIIALMSITKTNYLHLSNVSELASRGSYCLYPCQTVQDPRPAQFRP
jgi:hypothetical protein